MADTDASLAVTAHRALEELIVMRYLPPGETVTEKALAEQLGMGRTPVREAIQRLAADRLIRIRPRQGLTIAEIDTGEVAHALEVRTALEPLLAAEAARNAGAETRKALAETADAIAIAAEAGDLEGYLQLDKQADELLAEAAVNPFLAQAMKPIAVHCRRFWFRYRTDADLGRAARRRGKLLADVAAGKAQKVVKRANRWVRYLSEMPVRA